MIEIAPGVEIPETELTFSASRSGGPGGQHVNKTSSRIELRFDLDGSPSLTDEQKRRIRARLGARVSKEGVLRIVAATSRSQHANRAAALVRFQHVLERALRKPKARVETRVPAAAKRRRIEAKKVRGRLKRDRSVRDDEE
jgi:ribosome-associated protein